MWTLHSCLPYNGAGYITYKPNSGQGCDVWHDWWYNGDDGTIIYIRAKTFAALRFCPPPALMAAWIRAKEIYLSTEWFLTTCPPPCVHPYFTQPDHETTGGDFTPASTDTYALRVGWGIAMTPSLMCCQGDGYLFSSGGGDQTRRCPCVG